VLSRGEKFPSAFRVVPEHDLDIDHVDAKSTADAGRCRASEPPDLRLHARPAGQLKNRKAGGPHPFMVGTEPYVTFWSVVSECIQAEIVRRGD
jgi:hypothetical protein